MSSAHQAQRVPVLGSFRRIARLTWLELVKLVGQKLFPCIIVLTLVLTVGLGLVGRHFSKGETGVRFSNYSLWVVSSTYAVRIAMVLLVALGALAMSSEATARTLNTILARPIRRFEFVAAKALSLVVASLIVVVAAALSGFVMGGTVEDRQARRRIVVGADGEPRAERRAWRFPSYSDVVDPYYPDTVVLPRGQVMRTIFLGFLLLTVPALAAAFVGFLLGTVIDSTGLAVGLSVGFSVSLILGEFFPGFAGYLLPYSCSSPVPELATLMDFAGKGSLPVWDRALSGVGVSATYVAVSLLLSFIVFCRRDVTL